MNDTTHTSQQDHAERAINALFAAYAKAGEAAAERLNSEVEAAAERHRLALEVGKVQTRMEALGAVLEAVGTQKAGLLQARDRTDNPAMRSLYERQIEVLTAQEVSILERCGAPSHVAEETSRQLYVRDGSRFAPVEEPVAS